MSEKTYGGQEMVMIDSARRLFIEKGFEDTTMCDIAELAGVNRSTLHYYFPNKDVMFKAVFSSIVETLMPRLREIMSSDKPLIERLALVVDEYFERFLENPSIPGFIISEIQRDVEHFIATERDESGKIEASAHVHGLYCFLRQHCFPVHNQESFCFVV